MNATTYRIGEAAALLNLKTYVLRFWEMEFPQIAPLRTEKGQRLYSENDLAVLRRIRYLLHERGLTIDGARRILREEAAKGGLPPDAEPDITSITSGDSDAGGNAGGDVADDADGGASGGASGHAAADLLKKIIAPQLAPRSALSDELMREVAAELNAVRDLLKP